MKRRISVGLLFASPWLVGMVVFRFYPIGASIYNSFTEFDIVTPPFFVGLENYASLLRDDVFWVSLQNTIYLFLIGLPITVAVALFVAMLLNRRFPGVRVSRAIFYLPSVVPIVVIAIVWRWMLDAEVGMLNAILQLVGIRGPGWLGDPRWIKPALIMINCWLIGDLMLIFLASLKDVSPQLYEAADLEGASPVRKTLAITLPMISPIILFNVIIGIIRTFVYFDIPYIMTTTAGVTYGGPLRSATFYSMYLYNNAFRFYKMGYASAMAWILFIITIAVTLFVIRRSSNWIYYEAENR